MLLMTLLMAPLYGALERHELSETAPRMMTTQRVSLPDIDLRHEVAMLVAGTVLIGVAAAIRRAA